MGVQHAKGVLIGGDSAAGAGVGWTVRVRSDEKVFRNGPYVMGFTSSFRMGQLLRYALEPPIPTAHLDRFMATTFVDAVRECFKTGGWAWKDHDRESGGEFLVGVQGQLFAVYSDFQIARTATGYEAVGCGRDLALGALHATAPRSGGGSLAPQRRVRMALQAAADLSGGVAAPFKIMDGRMPS